MVTIRLKAKTDNEKLCKNYLKCNASDDLVKKINSSNKTLSQAWRYISCKAQLRAGNHNGVFVDDAQVFGWLVEFFKDDSITEASIRLCENSFFAKRIGAVINEEYYKRKYDEAMSKLAEYEEKTRNKHLIYAPCRIDDAIYYIFDDTNGLPYMKELIIKSITLDENFEFTVVAKDNTSECYIIHLDTDKRASLTKEGAVQKIAERRKK